MQVGRDLSANGQDVVKVLRGVPVAGAGDFAIPDVVGNADGGDVVLRGVAHDVFHGLQRVARAFRKVRVDVQVVKRKLHHESKPPFDLRQGSKSFQINRKMKFNFYETTIEYWGVRAFAP